MGGYDLHIYTGTFVTENFRSRERKFQRWNFRSLKLSFCNIDYEDYTLHDFRRAYSYAVGVYGIVVCLPSIRLSVCP